MTICDGLAVKKSVKMAPASQPESVIKHPHKPRPLLTLESKTMDLCDFLRILFVGLSFLGCSRRWGQWKKCEPLLTAMDNLKINAITFVTTCEMPPLPSCSAKSPSITFQRHLLPLSGKRNFYSREQITLKPWFVPVNFKQFSRSQRAK